MGKLCVWDSDIINQSSQRSQDIKRGMVRSWSAIAFVGESCHRSERVGKVKAKQWIQHEIVWSLRSTASPVQDGLTNQVVGDIGLRWDNGVPI